MRIIKTKKEKQMKKLFLALILGAIGFTTNVEAQNILKKVPIYYMNRNPNNSPKLRPDISGQAHNSEIVYNTADGKLYFWDKATKTWGRAIGASVTLSDSSKLNVVGGYTTTITSTAATTVTLPTSGTLYSTKTGSITSAQLAGSLTNETGTGVVVLATSPTLVTPVLGVATATSINGNTITTGTGTLTLGAGKTATVSNTLTFSGTDGSSVAFGAGGTAAYTGATLAQFASTSSSQLAGVLSDETGTGSVVYSTSPTLVTPTLGVASATSVNKYTMTAPATGATIALADGSGIATVGAYTGTFTMTGTTGVTLPTSGTLYGTASGSITSANLATSLTNETGTSLVVFNTSPTLVTPTITGGTATTAQLTDGATIASDASAAVVNYVTLGGNRTMSAISNFVNGQRLVYVIVQDGTGSRTLAWTDTIKWKGGSAPTLTTTASKADIITLWKINSVIYGDSTLNY